MMIKQLRSVNGQQLEPATFLKVWFTNSLILVGMLLFTKVNAQWMGYHSGPEQYFGNTGTTLGAGNIGTAITPGASDVRWQVSTTSSSGLGGYATVVSPFAGCSWSPTNSAQPQSQWITTPAANCGPTGNYSCNTISDAWFRVDFTLTNPIFNIHWQLYASDWIQDIRVNGVTPSAFDIGTVNPSSPPSHRVNALDFKWCKFQTGNNYIIVHVKTKNSGINPCKVVGLKVLSGGGVYPFISGNTIQCANSTTTSYAATCPGSTGIPSTVPYNWQFPTGWIVTPTIGTTPTGTCNRVAAAGPLAVSGLVQLNIQTVSSTGTLCWATAAYSVTVPPPLTITASPSTVICKGSCVTLNASGAIGPYTWIPNSTPPNSNPATFCPVGPIVYTVSGVTPVGNCTYSRSIQINVVSPPTIYAMATKSTICQGQSTSIVASASGFGPQPAPGALWNWSPSLTPTVNPQSVSPNVNTTYNVNIMGANGCQANAAITINVLPTPVLNITATPSVVCFGSPTTLQASGATSYTWLPPINSNASQVSVVPTAPTNYVVQGTVSTNTCVGSANININVLSVPFISITPSVVCSGVPNTLTATGANNYTWMLNSFGNVVAQNTNAIIIAPNAPATVYVLGVGGVGSQTCLGMATITIPAGQIATISAPDVTFCTSSALCNTVSANTTFTSATSYSWYALGAATPFTVGATPTLCPPLNATTVYSVNAVAVTGCSLNTTMAVRTVSNCCTSPTTGLQVITGPGIYANGSFLIDQSILLNSNTIFQEADVWITPKVAITVQPGVFLNLDKAHLYACSNTMWQGIIVKDGGRIITGNTFNHSSLIEDAETAIQLDNISASNSGVGTPPIEIEGLIFNNNYEGIRISNSSPAGVALNIDGCVFSSRTMPYTNYPTLPPFTWPNADLFAGNLRTPATPTTGLIPPYNFNLMPQNNNIKAPYNNQPSKVGITIQNTGLIAFGVTQPILNDFNLFDGIGCGVDLLNGDLLTKNNVFQSMQRYFDPSAAQFYGGMGMSLINNTGYPNSAQLPGTTYEEGNRFYDCMWGIIAKDIAYFRIERGIFRSTHQYNSTPAINPMPGDYGILFESPRLNTEVLYSQFNNLKTGVEINTPVMPTPYYQTTLSTTPIIGIDATQINIAANYFGAEVTSATPYSGPNMPNTTEYMSDAIRVNEGSAFGWQSAAGGQSYIVRNKIDRAFRGVSIFGTEDLPLTVSNNSIFIEEDFTTNPNSTTATFGFGIGCESKADNLSVKNNTLSCNNVSGNPGNKVSMVWLKENYGNGSPYVQCNQEKFARYGFHFEGNNPSTIWEGNDMCDNWAGLALTNTAVIGPQGNSSTCLSNVWSATCSPWGVTQNSRYKTYCEDSDPTQSTLYVIKNAIPYDPTFNSAPLMNFAIGAYPFYDYGNGIATASMTTTGDCLGNNPYGPTPSWRQANTQTGIDSEKIQDGELKLYPNPTKGIVNIECNSSIENIQLYNANGTQVISKKIGGNLAEIDLSSLPPGIYLIQVSTENTGIIRKKLVKID